MSTSTVQTLQAQQARGIVALAVSLSPLYLLMQTRSRLGLDALHIGLVQVIFLLILQYVLDPTLFFRSAAVPAAAVPTPVAAVAATATKKTSKRKGKKAAVVAPPSLFPPALLDTTLTNFLSITEPSYTSLLPPSTSPSTLKLPESAALSTWKSLYETATLQVLQHPTTKTLYAICAKFEDVPIRKLFETLCTVEKRIEWDGMCSGVEAIEAVEVGGRKGSVAWLGMKGVAVIKAKDMVLLSVVGMLPPAAGATAEKPGPLRLFCGTTSFLHPKYPVRSDYNRMELGVSGFLAEEVGNGSRVVQITDLSGLGSWVPSAVVRTVTTTMIPKSLVKLGKTAAQFDLATSQFPLEGNDWLPPLLGSSDDTIVAPSAAVADEADEEDDEEDAEEEDDDIALSPSSSRDLHSLLGQLRTLTTRLTALETAGPAPRTHKSRILSAVAGMDQMTMSTGAAVGAVSAAVAVSILGRWGSRRNY